jgi:mRNA interferase YafQ
MEVVKTSQFKKDVKLSLKRHKESAKLKEVFDLLLGNVKLPEKYRDHKLQGTNYRECHIEPDWLLVYRIEGDTLHLIRTGTHADLFE